MGQRGPVPKRSTERRRQNKESKPETIAVTIGATVEIPAPNPAWHAIAQDWYVSLGQSGQSKFFEPSDWQAARYVADVMSRNLKQRAKFSAVLFASVWSAMGDLLTTEAERRRVRMEIDRGDKPEQPASVTAIADYRTRAGAAKKR